MVASLEAELSSCSNSMGVTSQADVLSVVSNSNPIAELQKISKIGTNLGIEIKNGKKLTPSLELKGQFAQFAMRD